MKQLIQILILLISMTLFSQVERIEPPFWWIGFNSSELQLLVRHEGIGASQPEINFPGVTIQKVTQGESPNYLFIDLQIAKSTQSGTFKILFKFKDGKKIVQPYELKSREKSSIEYVGFDSSDVIYLITPDRFANGNPSNDQFQYLNEKSIDRSDDYARHGGDIRGIINHLDYIDDMGFTAIWPSPLLTNDMDKASYHGYAMTDFYQVDPRFGTFSDYRELSDKSRSKGIKLIMDQVANHCGGEHWWMKDLPFNDWVNYQNDYKNKGELKTSNHRRTSNQDTYASDYDKELLSSGWFVPSMPDLNQKNSFMAKYIIQNSIWWIESLGLGGIRQDTYPYPDKKFMATWAGTIMNEYPNFSIVGEEWSYNPLLIGYWQKGANNRDGYESNLRSTMDFAMQRLIVDALTEEEQWDKGLVKIYEGLANDFHYATPRDIMAFPDNHDMSRIFTQLHENVIDTKTALSYLLVLPRIPQIYYGTEILMNDTAKPGDHGLIRTDFPGGWEGDTVNAFTGEGLSEQQKDMQSYLKKLLNFRKGSKAIHEGKTVHFAPDNGIYVLFRVKDDETVMHIINKNNEPVVMDLSKYDEMNLKGRTVRNVISNESFSWPEKLTLNNKGSLILTTK